MIKKVKKEIKLCDVIYNNVPEMKQQIKEVEDKEQEKEQSYETIKMLYDEINDLYNISTGPNGSSEKCYKKLIMFKEAK